MTREGTSLLKDQQKTENTSPGCVRFPVQALPWAVALSGLSALRPESDLRTGSQTAPSRRFQATGRFQRIPALRIARNKSLAAASSLGEAAPRLDDLPNDRCRLSKAFIVWIIFWIAGGKANIGTTCSQARCQTGTIAG